MLCSCQVKQNLYCGTSNKCGILALDIHAAAAGNVDVNPVEGDKTATGAQKETFGTGSSAQSEAGKKGGAISGESSNVGSPLTVCSSDTPAITEQIFKGLFWFCPCSHGI